MANRDVAMLQRPDVEVPCVEVYLMVVHSVECQVVESTVSVHVD